MTAKLRLSALPFAAACVALALGGCGGNSGAAGAAPMTKAEFVRRANAGCRKARVGLEQRVKGFERLKADEEPEPYADAVHFVLLPTIEAELRAIRKVPPPAGEKRRIHVIVYLEQRVIDELAVSPHVSSVPLARQHFIKSTGVFHAYGLDDCVNGPKGS